MDKDSLKKLTVPQLREEAKKIPGIKGISSMKKDELIEVVAQNSSETAGAELAVTAAKTAEAGKKPAAGGSKPADKSEIKNRIRALKDEKREAIASNDGAKAKHCNRQIHIYKRRLRRMARKKSST